MMTRSNSVSLLFLLLSVAYGQQGGFADYDYPEPLAPARPAPKFRGSSGPTNAPKPTPVPILKQINRHNDDGSYTYGYEAADGSFKIETKQVNGEVMGKYGYVDDRGKLRVVEYGANRYGFQPSGEGITVAAPTLVDETTRRGPKGEIIEEIDDGSYYEPPTRPTPRPKKVRPVVESYQQPNFAEPPRPKPQPRPVFESYQQPNFVEPVRPKPQPQPVFENYQQPGERSPVPVRELVPDAHPTNQQFRPAPQRAAAAVRQNTARAGVLDQLEQQYALPRGAGTPLHDITFGSYSSETSF